ncbi:MAG: hypothetical protein PHF29_08455, partial [Candidatus Riflebacteria bacterium]|nr:hypothetical protein [Candidatus Riflebacteria bacterium]
DDLTPQEKTEFKHAFTRHRKALAMIKDRLPEEFKKIDRMLKDNIIVMKPKMQEMIDKRAIFVDDDRLRAILEIMINDNCTDCKVKNWKDCHIYQLNDDLEVSSEYQEPAGECPFCYMLVHEKAKNPTYGTIFKDNKK